jgi:hypothetical protein
VASRDSTASQDSTANQDSTDHPTIRARPSHRSSSARRRKTTTGERRAREDARRPVTSSGGHKAVGDRSGGRSFVGVIRRPSIIHRACVGYGRSWESRVSLIHSSRDDERSNGVLDVVDA